MLDEIEWIVVARVDLFWLKICILDLALCLYVYNEGGSNPECALYCDLASHLLDNLLTDTEPKSSTSFVPIRVLSEFAEIDKEIL